MVDAYRVIHLTIIKGLSNIKITAKHEEHLDISSYSTKDTSYSSKIFVSENI